MFGNSKKMRQQGVSGTDNKDDDFNEKYVRPAREFLSDKYELHVQKQVPWRYAWPLISTIEGWLLEGQEEWLFTAARSLPREANIVEIGSFKGRSTCCLAIPCINTERYVYAIDTFRGNDSDFIKGQNMIEWKNDSYFDEFMNNLKKCGVEKYVMPLAGKSSVVADMWKLPIHMLFIDGSHDYKDVLADFEGFYPNVVSGGLIALHDVTPDWAGPYKVWNEHAKPLLKDTGMFSTIAYGRKP